MIKDKNNMKIAVSLPIYEYLDKLRTTPMGKLSFNDVVNHLIDKKELKKNDALHENQEGDKNGK